MTVKLSIALESLLWYVVDNYHGICFTMADAINVKYSDNNCEVK